MRLPFARFVQELKRRKVLQATSLYIVTAWGISLGASELLPNFGVPEWVVRGIVVAFVVLLPVVIALAWYFELTIEGFVRDPKDTGWFDKDSQAGGSTRKRLLENLRSKEIASTVLEITWQTGKEEKKQVFTKAFSLGRDITCEVSTPDPLASRRHADVGHENNRWWIRDLESRNGTYLDGKRIKQAFLSLSCTVLLGENGQQFKIQVMGRNATTVSGIPQIAPSE